MLFAVTRTATPVRLVVDAASLVAEDGRFVFRTAEGDPLMILAAEDVMHVETVNAPQPPSTFLDRLFISVTAAGSAADRRSS